MKKHLLTLVVALLASVATFAAEWKPVAEAEAYPALQLDAPFVVANMDFSTVWTYTATQNGIVKIVGATDDEYFGPCLDVFSDEACTAKIDNFIYFPAHYEFSVTAGGTYYIRNNNWCGQDIHAKLTMGASKFELTHAEPADGGMLSITTHETAYLRFTSSNVTFTEGEVTAGGDVIKVYNYSDYNRLVAEGVFTYTEEGSSGVANWNGAICARSENEDGIAVSFTSATGHGYFNVINKLYEEGKLAAGDPIKLTMHGVKNSLTGELLNEDGNVEVAWTFAGAPTVLVSAAIPSVIKSWYNAGDTEGLASFTFSRDIQSARAMLEMGQGEGADDLYVEEIASDHIIVDGSTVTVDLTGVMRTKTTMNLKMNWSTFTITLYSVIDANGNETYSGDLGSASSYTYSASYRDISAALSYEITPATGSSLTADNKSVEIWFDNSDLITYDGVTVTYYTQETITETVTELVYNPETGTFDSNEREVETTQNIPHETFIPNSQLAITVEADGTTIVCPLPEGIHEAMNVCVKLNITGSTDGLDHTVAAYYNTTVMYGLQPALSAEPQSESTVSRLTEIYLTLGYVYAINPAKADQIKVTSRTGAFYEATGTVVPDGMTNVKIVLSEPISEAGSYIVEVPEGVVGDYVYGESGFTSGTTHEAFNLYYTCDGRYAGKSVVCDPDEGTVPSLQQFAITFFDYAAVAPTWDSEKCPYVKDADDKKYPGDFAESTGEAATSTIVFTLAQPITVDGVYTLVLPAGSVANAANGDPIGEAYEFTFTVDSSVVPATKPVVNPAEGTVDEIGDILVDFGQPVTLVVESEENNYWVPQPTLISTDGGWTLFASGKLAATEDPNVLEWVNWGGVAVKACDVEFSIPAGCVMFADGTTNSEYTYTYTITGANAVTLSVVATTPEQWTEVEELSEMTVTFDQPVTFDEWNTTVSVNNDFWTKMGEGHLVATEDPCTVKIVFDEPLRDYGSAVITLGGYTFITASGKYYEETIYLNITIGEDNGGGGGNNDPVEDENVTITPNGLDGALPSLKYFEITFGGYVGAWNEQPITLADQFDNVIATVGAYAMSSMNAEGQSFWELGKPNTYSITLPREITEEGYYVLTVPVVCEKPDGNTVNREFYFMFPVSAPDGVKAFGAAGGKLNIHTVGGVKVNSLDKPGLYIVNGRKVLVK